MMNSPYFVFLFLSFWAMQCVKASQVILLPEPQGAINSKPAVVWSAAIRLRNGNQFYIANSTEIAVVDNNLYTFQSGNLYFVDSRRGKTIFLTYLIPQHAPVGLSLLKHAISSAEEEGHILLIHTASCVLSLDFEPPNFYDNDPQVYVMLGNCYEEGVTRDGPPLFARFHQIQAVVPVVSPSLTLVVLDQSRLCALTKEGRVVSTSILAGRIQAITAAGLSLGAVAVVVGWTSGGLTLFRDGNASSLLFVAEEDVWAPERSFLALTSLAYRDAAAEIFYVFSIDSQACVQRWRVVMTNATEMITLQTERVLPPGQTTSLILDWPYGLFAMDVVRMDFVPIKSLGCLCPPGSAMLTLSHCQPAPTGGFVDLLGYFTPCLPGTYGLLGQATAAQVCQPCPPQSVSQEAQSTFCQLCLNGTVADPTGTACLVACPEGSRPILLGCAACPPGQTYSAALQRCAVCPANTFSSSPNYTCTPCSAGSYSAPGSSVCSPLCPRGTCSFADGSTCTPLAPDKSLSVFTIAVLGVHPVDMAVATNGSVYVVAFQLLIVVDLSGSSTETLVPDFSMARGLALSWDESVLFVAVTQEQVACLTFVGTSGMQTAWKVFVPQSVTVGIRPLGPGGFAIWDAGTNAVFRAPGPAWYQGDASNEIMAMIAGEGSILLFLQNIAMGNQSILQWPQGQLYSAPPEEPPLNPYMALWSPQRLVLSSRNTVFVLELVGAGRVVAEVGMPNMTGCVDSSTSAGARFTQPGPMMRAPNARMLLVVDQNALRVLYNDSMVCACSESFFAWQQQEAVACLSCPVGLSSMIGALGCTPCIEGQYNDEGSGACVPCPRARWWQQPAQQPCSEFIDTMVKADAVGLSWVDIVSELLSAPPLVQVPWSMVDNKDYVSLQTLVLPIQQDAVLLDAAAQGRFWTRLQRISPPPAIYDASMMPMTNVELKLILPGLWVECSQYVLQSEPCTCQLPAGGITLGSSDPKILWNQMRAAASAIDYQSLWIQIPADPDLYGGGQTEVVYYTNLSVTMSSLFVSRTDAGGGTDEDNINTFFIRAVDQPMNIPIPAAPSAAPSESAFAACVAGWPATYACPDGFLWVPSVFTCMPCKPGYYFADGACQACPIGSYSAGQASTGCASCPSAKASGSSQCSSSNNASGIQPQACQAGYEDRGKCLPCVPGFAKSGPLSSAACAACPPGKFSNAPGRTACATCTLPFVSTQWASTGCILCGLGFVPSGQGNACLQCRAGAQYFFNIKPVPLCMDKTVLSCGQGFYLDDGGYDSDNQCKPCLPCAQGQIMAPFLANPCSYSETSVLGPPYRCVPLESVPGQFSRISLLPSVSSSAAAPFSVQYTPCQGLPQHTAWAAGPQPSMCFFQCEYGIAGQQPPFAERSAGLTRRGAGRAHQPPISFVLWHGKTGRPDPGCASKP